MILQCAVPMVYDRIVQYCMCFHAWYCTDCNVLYCPALSCPVLSCTVLSCTVY